MTIERYIYVTLIVILLTALVITYIKSRKKCQLVTKKYTAQEKQLKQQSGQLTEANKYLTDYNEEILQQQEEIAAQAESLKESLKKLRELNEFKEGMTAMIVHDLKNPLNIILNYAQNEEVIESGKQMLNMVNNILDVHRFESLKMPLNKNNYWLENIIDNAIGNTSYLMQQKNISFEKQMLKNYELIVDTDLIERVLINLLSNAIKYTPQNEVITVKVSELNKNNVKIEVIDNGPGIPEKLKGRVFEKFVQIIAKKSGNTRSSGLGLTLCKLAVEAHNGEIGIETEVGKGTTFWFTLPIEKVGKTLSPINQNKSSLSNKEMSKKDLASIQPFIEKLVLLDVFETSKIQVILSKIQQLNIASLTSWLKAIENATYSVNQQEYEELLVRFVQSG